MDGKRESRSITVEVRQPAEEPTDAPTPPPAEETPLTLPTAETPAP
jgi:hypothetical protein